MDNTDWKGVEQSFSFQWSDTYHKEVKTKKTWKDQCPEGRETKPVVKCFGTVNFLCLFLCDMAEVSRLCARAGFLVTIM